MAMADDKIQIVADLASCEALWQPPSRDWRLLQDWELRRELAQLDGVEPYFITHQSGTVLPLGKKNDHLFFYGGRRYNERNGFIGSSGGERAILEFLRQSKMHFRLLSWETDPLPFVPRDCTAWDVPYNQYWEISEVGNVERWLKSLSDGTAADIAYLERKFKPVILTDVPLDLVSEFIGHTIEAIESRGGGTSHNENRPSTMFSLRYLANRGKLRAVKLQYRGADIGLGVFAIDTARKEAVYLLNLYKRTPAKASNCLVATMIKFCVERGYRLDGMRGAFALKPRYGYRPQPSYALVNDPSWVIDLTSDLEADALIRLYGRPFGATAPALS